MLYGYRFFMLVHHCNEVRQGYLLQFISDDELARSEIAIHAIVRKAKLDDPSIDSDALWRDAIQMATKMTITRDYCQLYFGQLPRISPVPVYSTNKPRE
jgi:hypothetical protein